ncbi:MAG TPA: hypothetical protein DEA90_06300 [Opitutae bacterium]|nr:hypothetical protein [Opitutae bacterium]
MKFFTNKSDTTNLATTDDLSKFTVDFSLFTDGLVSASENFIIALAFNGNKSANKTIAATNGSYVDFSFSLSDFTYSTAPTIGDLNGGLQVTIESSYLKGDETYGYDTGNAIRLDNVTVTQIPEPSTFASLAGLLALGAAVIRRRS